MTTTVRTMEATPDAVWQVLADGWLYPLWVVGASRMREVDDAWPAVGACLHHSVGAWPLLLDDSTEVLEAEPGRLLRLDARAQPGGRAHVVLRLVPEGEGTRVEMEEDVVSGPGVLIPRPLRAPLITWRNVESLRRLAFLAERRAAPAG